MSSPSPSIEDLLQRNARRQETFEPILTLAEINNLPPEKSLPMPKIFIVSCCDPRVDPWDILGLEKWDAVVTRGAAGRMAPQLNNMLFLDHILQFTDIMIIHHTDCSAELLSNSDVCESLIQRAPEASGKVGGLTFPGFEDLERSVLEDVQLVKRSPLVRKELAERTRGFVYDLKTGEVRPAEEGRD
ncbi:carbonic anhydrase [Aspergillus karnatakaensis]|uniref:carbonic anhydrase n=1 Tax=Aspergillus karnatakaensis TaxID=1810916 RepID=UPI003CCE32FE